MWVWVWGVQGMNQRALVCMYVCMYVYILSFFVSMNIREYKWIVTSIREQSRMSVDWPVTNIQWALH